MTNSTLAVPSDHASTGTVPKPLRRKLKWLMMLVLGFVFLFVGFGLGSDFYRASRNTSVPLMLIQMSSPVVCEIVYRPQLKHPDDLEDILQHNGLAEFVFTNYSNEPVKIAFPPLRAFAFTAEHFSHDVTLPAFAKEQKTHEIPAGESIRFETTHGGTLVGDDRSFLKGGPGYVGFVFSRPEDAIADENYLVGTIYPWYSVYAQDGSTNDEEMARAAKFNFSTTKYTDQGKPVKDLVIWQQK
ncbi:MAG: hypothetical protein O2955_09470 [Planctomycetota bacterium]|nr:hypothetical protein [Planctomycetota bacterium]MDA1212738.1 hypothetical protein [Planctomycetota bacterium]